MKKIIISTALTLIPTTLQNKAICKALNYIFAPNELSEFNYKIVRITVNELKKSWLVTNDGTVFKPTKAKIIDLDVSINLDTAMNLQSKSFILMSMKNENIQLKGEGTLITAMFNLLHNVNEKRLKDVSESLFSFLKIKKVKKEKINLDTVQLSDLKNKEDVDFIRDEALFLEKTNPRKALSLMLLAQQARPNGPFIKRKVLQYEKLLSK